MRKPIDVKKLKKVFRLNEGALERFNNVFRNGGKWTIVCNKSSSVGGYCQVWFDKRLILYHVIIWILSTGEDVPQGMEIDHINGNKIDNRIENLRLVTRRGNQQNRKIHRDGKVVGYTYRVDRKKYESSITIKGKTINLGRYVNKEDACKIYKLACKHIGEYVSNDTFRNMLKEKAFGGIK